MPDEHIIPVSDAADRDRLAGLTVVAAASLAEYLEKAHGLTPAISVAAEVELIPDRTPRSEALGYLLSCIETVAFIRAAENPRWLLQIKRQLHQLWQTRSSHDRPWVQLLSALQIGLSTTSRTILTPPQIILVASILNCLQFPVTRAQVSDFINQLQRLELSPWSAIRMDTEEE